MQYYLPKNKLVFQEYFVQYADEFRRWSGVMLGRITPIVY